MRHALFVMLLSSAVLEALTDHYGPYGRRPVRTAISPRGSLGTSTNPEFNYPDPSINGPRLLLYGASDTTIRNGSMSGTIAGTASTTLDLSRQCCGTHRVSLIATGG